MSTTSDDEWTDPYEELYENPLNAAAYSELTNIGPKITEKLIALLESQEPVTWHIRVELVQALRAGLSKRHADPRQVQICVANDGLRKSGHPKYRENQRRTSIERAKAIRHYKAIFGAKSLRQTLDKMADPPHINKMADRPKPIDPPAEERTLNSDLVFYDFMREWIETCDPVPFFLSLRTKAEIEQWRASLKAEQDFIIWGPDKPKGWKKNKNRKQ